MEKLILTDCDGVLFDWEAHFETWMNTLGYVKIPNYDVTAYGLHIHYGIPKNEVQDLVKQFNESSAIGFCGPFRDSVEYVKKLSEEGWLFHVITSLSDNKYSGMARALNLKNVFGDVFEKMVYLPVGADKDDALKPYKNRGLYWIEDKKENAIAGYNINLKPILIAHDHNEIDNPLINIPRFHTWKEIYEHINS